MARQNPELGPDHLRALARSSLAFFCRGGMKQLLPQTDILWNWHLDLIASRLEDVMEGRTRRLIINIPPRYGKSLLASVCFPAFILGHNPAAEVVCVSYAQDLAEKMASDTRRLMNSAYYLDLFGGRLASPRSRLAELKTLEGGCRLATSVEGTLTGRGGDIIIIDDPLKPSEARSDTQRLAVNRWYDSTAATRANNKETGAIIVIMQRLHEDDLVGHLQEQGHWEVLSLPAIAEEDEEHHIRTPLGVRTYRRKEGELLHPARESMERIREAQVTLGSYDFAAQYQQRPAPAGGGDIRPEWFPSFDPQRPPEFVRKVQSWDTAAKDGERNDYSACTTVGETKDRTYYVLDVYRGRLKFPELKRKVRELAELHEVSTVLIEDTSSGIQLIQEMRSEGFARLQAIKPKGSKYQRITARTAMIEAEKVWLPSQAHWRDGLLHEAAMFPNGKHDDQLDSLAQALEWMADCSGPEYWLWMMKEVDRMRREEAGRGAIPTIRVNHPELGMQFQLFGGRRPKREEDGSFLVTEEELKYLGQVKGLWVVE